MILKYSVGLDVSSKDIKFCISTIDYSQEVRVLSRLTILNTKAGFSKAVTWMNLWHKEKKIPLVLCMEATGVYHENCAYFFYEKGYQVSVVLPNKSKKYLECLGLKSKNDEIDAQGLSQMGAEQKLPYWQPAIKFYGILRIITRQYQSLQEQINSEGNRLHAATNSALQSKFELKQTSKLIAFLKSQLKEVAAEIKKHCESDIEIKEKFTQLCTIYGISILSASTIIAETNGFELFENYKQVVSFAGYDVIENQSGMHTGKTKISKKGNSRIRRILHMPALVAIKQKDSKFGKLYQRVSTKSGVKMKGVVAVQKKLLVIIYHVWKKGLTYNANFGSIPKEEQEPTSRLALQKPREEKVVKRSIKIAVKTGKKLAITSMAKQGKRSVSDHSTPPLGKTKVLKKKEKIFGF
jgi:transposase